MEGEGANNNVLMMRLQQGDNWSSCMLGILVNVLQKHSAKQSAEQEQSEEFRSCPFLVGDCF